MQNELREVIQTIKINGEVSYLLLGTLSSEKSAAKAQALSFLTIDVCFVGTFASLNEASIRSGQFIGQTILIA